MYKLERERGSHGEVTAGVGGNGSPVSCVVDDKQYDDDDDDDDDAGDERTHAPRHRTQHLVQHISNTYNTRTA